MSIQSISGISEIADKYDAILCDVWGVLHNGQKIYDAGAHALQTFRQNGGVVVMITNAPRPREPVLRQLNRLGCPDGVFDDVVTSGDVTRNLIEQVNGPVFHIGPERDFTLYEGLDVEFADVEHAAAAVSTGLFNDREETPDDYVELHKTMKENGLPFICANPDIVVEFGDQLLWCAGALARDYAAIGGETKIAGKPHAPIYTLAIEKAEAKLGRSLDLKRILAIGDGMPTDMLGARDFGLDALFIAGSIHMAEYATDGIVDEAAMISFLSTHEMSPSAWQKRLSW